MTTFYGLFPLAIRVMMQLCWGGFGSRRNRPDQWLARRPDGAVLKFNPAPKKGQSPSPFIRTGRPARGCLTSQQVRVIVTPGIKHSLNMHKNFCLTILRDSRKHFNRNDVRSLGIHFVLDAVKGDIIGNCRWDDPGNKMK